MRVGVNPILWSNDDFHDLGGDLPLERCLAEMHEAGYEGTELGHKYPRDAAGLRAALAPHGLDLVSGWHSLHLLERSPAGERRGLERHLDLLRACGSRVAIVAECSRRTYVDAARPLSFAPNGEQLTTAEWERLAGGLESLAEGAAAGGMRLAYHHHMGTVVQREDEVDELMARTRTLGLLVDTGHLAFAGADPLGVLARHAARVVHVHLKNVRPAVVERVRDEHRSFAWAVRRGVFTVPGDGGLDFAPIFAALRTMDYDGWLVVEAEQDPALAPPLEYARRGREYVRRCTGF